MARLKIGIAGRPNAGKSTLFSALTGIKVDIADYAFTTVQPNVGLSYIMERCPEGEIGRKCSPREGFCRNGMRAVPVEVVDVPGLIEGASQGKGMGNEFLDALRNSDAIINLFDGTSVRGGKERLAAQAEEVEREIVTWFADRMARDWERFSRRADASGERIERSLHTKLASFGLSEADISTCLSKGVFPQRLSIWGADDFHEFAGEVFRSVKPIVRVANKGDLLSDGEIREVREALPGCDVISADYELTLTRAFNLGIISSTDTSFDVSGRANSRQAEALETIRSAFRSGRLKRAGEILRAVAKERLRRIVVYPVQDETHWTDSQGNVLPDALMVPEGTTALDLAYMIHTEIGDGFIRAIDGRTKRALGKEHELRDGDVVKIVSRAK